MFLLKKLRRNCLLRHEISIATMTSVKKKSEWKKTSVYHPKSIESGFSVLCASGVCTGDSCVVEGGNHAAGKAVV